MQGYPAPSWYGMSSDLNSHLRSPRVVLLQEYQPKGLKIPAAPKNGYTAPLQLVTDQIKG